MSSVIFTILPSYVVPPVTAVANVVQSAFEVIRYGSAAVPLPESPTAYAVVVVSSIMTSIMAARANTLIGFGLIFVIFII
jgi:hypothetical protein